MNTIQPAIIRSAYSVPVSKALASVRPAQRTENSTRESEPEGAPSRPAEQQLQTRAQLLRQQPQMDHRLPQRSRLAIDAYRTLDASAEREKLSSLLGIDEYA